MKWIDMHCDTLSELEKETAAESLQKNAGLCVDVERLLNAGSRAQFFACFVNAGRMNMDWELAWKEVLRLIDSAYKEENEQFYIVRPSEKNYPFLTSDKKLAGILTVEEGGVLNGMAGRLEQLHSLGVRLITLTWNYKNCIGSPNSRDAKVMGEGLTGFGMETVERMNHLGMIIDVSHLSDGGFWDCIRQSRAPVAASHSNARSLCGHPRNLSDEMLHALGENGGVAGLNFYSAFLVQNTRRSGENGSKKGVESLRASAADIARHAKWMIDKAGEDAVALGTDFDGFGMQALPEGMRGVQDMEKVWNAFEKEGLTPRQIEKIAYQNVMRLMRDVSFGHLL